MEQFNFYESIGNFPFKRNIQDLKEHFEQRELLLHKLGVPPLLLQHANVLEIGGGYGENALFLLAQPLESFLY